VTDRGARAFSLRRRRRGQLVVRSAEDEGREMGRDSSRSTWVG
jgi:hypothetical protein